jgi:DNA mismatch endonuclease (patch repair protein)
MKAPEDNAAAAVEANLDTASHRDIYPPGKRSQIMGKVRTKDTAPERAVRSALHALGYRFRLQAALPGKPDIVLPSRRVAVFVHGCFWHQHQGCARAKMPATRADWWRAKLLRNVERDAETQRELEKMGWNVVIVWQCQTRRPAELAAMLKGVIEESGAAAVRQIGRAPNT